MTHDEIRDRAWEAIRDALHADLHNRCRYNSTSVCLALRECADNARIALGALAEAGIRLEVSE